MKKIYEKCVEQSIKEQEERLYTEEHKEAFYQLIGMRTILTFSNRGEKYEKMIDNAFDKYFRRNKKELNEAVESNV